MSAAPSPWIPRPVAVRKQGMPDLRFIKAQIRIADVARKLGLRVCGTQMHCWRPENHQHSDRTPSVSLSKKNRACCHVCDAPHDFSSVDLVMQILGCPLPDAIMWIANRFDVPWIPRSERPTKPATRIAVVGRVGTGGPLESLIRSGLWRKLTLREQSALSVFSNFADSNGSFTISYKGITKFTGVGSYTTVSRILSHFVQLGMLEIQRDDADNLVRPTNTYRLTLDSAPLHKLIQEMFEQQRRHIEQEKGLRRERREQRRKQRAEALHTKVKSSTSLHAECSNHNFVATHTPVATNLTVPREPLTRHAFTALKTRISQPQRKDKSQPRRARR
jgi:hypothetical protein